MKSPRMWWHTPEDERQAGGFKRDDTASNYAREDLMVLKLPPRYSIWKRAALVVRVYQDDRVTLAEGEWRD